MSDKETLAAYTRNVETYAERFTRNRPDPDLSAFIDAVAPGGRVLDLGCGPGNSAAMMRDAGLVAEASDATPAMAAIAAERYGLTERVEPFDALDARETYDGIWANFSLLHAPRA